MFYETMDLLNLEFTLTKRKKIARIFLKAQEVLKNAGFTSETAYENDNFDAVVTAAPTNTPKEYIEFVTALLKESTTEVQNWANKIMQQSTTIA